MKSICTLTKTLLIVLIALPFGLSAQNTPQFVELDKLEVASVDNKMILMWETALESRGGYFLVEKLDENWDYVTVGKINIISGQTNALNTYSIEDAEPMQGENYYRITVVDNTGAEFLTDLLIADHFTQPTKTDFEFLFNDKFAQYAQAKIGGNTKPLQTGYFGKDMYAQNMLKVRRLRKTLLEPDYQDNIKINTLTATIEKK